MGVNPVLCPVTPYGLSNPAHRGIKLPVGHRVGFAMSGLIAMMRWGVPGLALAFFLLVGSLLAGPLRAECRDDVVHLRGDWGQARFRVELARTVTEKARGLMGRESLPRGNGMLFLYKRPSRLAYWMRNTLIPLDIMFIDRRGVVVRLHENARPHDETLIRSGRRVSAVLEINGGMSRAMGIGPGTQLRHPAFGAEALWACE